MDTSVSVRNRVSALTDDVALVANINGRDFGVREIITLHENKSDLSDHRSLLHTCDVIREQRYVEPLFSA